MICKENKEWAQGKMSNQVGRYVMDFINSDVSKSQSILVHLVLGGVLDKVCIVPARQVYTYSLLMRANKLKAVLFRNHWLVWSHYDSFFSALVKTRTGLDWTARFCSDTA